MKHLILESMLSGFFFPAPAATESPCVRQEGRDMTHSQEQHH